jgi:gamma-glutamylcyclotransferase (GGCT)/AIG2-like uncharacterized protein YtfP
MNKHLIFIYGSLRRGSAGAMSIRFPNSKFVAEAKVNGNLYDLGLYPGLVLNGSNSLVTGEVYEVDDEVLSELDDFEATSNYCRRQVEIPLGNQLTVGWTYEPNPGSYDPDALITSGDWIEYAKTKTDWPVDTPVDKN